MVSVAEVATEGSASTNKTRLRSGAESLSRSPPDGIGEKTGWFGLMQAIRYFIYQDVPDID